MGPNQTEKLLYTKGNHKTKRQLTEWKQIFANPATDKGLKYTNSSCTSRSNKTTQSKNEQKI